MNANSIQVGGDHYRTGSGLQHWDLMDKFDVPYLEATGSKYLVRWRKKNGRQDLEKAGHYVQKVIEQAQAAVARRSPCVPLEDVAALCADAECCALTTDAMQVLLQWSSIAHLRALQAVIAALLLEDRTGQERPFGFDPAQDA